MDEKRKQLRENPSMNLPSPCTLSIRLKNPVSACRCIRMRRWLQLVCNDGVCAPNPRDCLTR